MPQSLAEGVSPAPVAFALRQVQGPEVDRARVEDRWSLGSPAEGDAEPLDSLRIRVLGLREGGGAVAVIAERGQSEAALELAQDVGWRALDYPVETGESVLVARRCEIGFAGGAVRRFRVGEPCQELVGFV
jgi:hypothetical protein